VLVMKNTVSLLELASKASVLCLTTLLLYLGGCSNSTDSNRSEADSSEPPPPSPNGNLAPPEDELRLVSIQSLEDEIADQNRNLKDLGAAFKALDYRPPFCGTREHEMVMSLDSYKRKLEGTAPNSPKLARLNQLLDKMEQDRKARSKADEGKAKSFFELQTSISMARLRSENLAAELKALRGKTIVRIERRARVSILKTRTEEKAEQNTQPSLADILGQ
jgi:hypothetical protein